MKNETDIKKARQIIKDDLSNIDNIVYKTLNNKYEYEINYGYNYFPKKEYKNKTYEAGNYESLLIKLGKAQGDNWWCILFPPICLVEAEENEKTEYGFFLKDLIDSFFNKK